MDPMDIDQIVEVPDTPDRLAKHGTNGRNADTPDRLGKHGINGRNGVKTENQRPSMPRHGQKMFLEEGSRDQPMIIDSGSRGMSLHPPKRPSNPKNSQCPNTSAPFSLESSPSSRNSNLYRKGATDKKSSYLTHDSMHKHLEPVRLSYPSKSSSSSEDDNIFDLTECSLHGPSHRNASPSALPGNNRADFQKRSELPNGTSSHDLSNLADASCNGNGEKMKLGRGGLGIALGERTGFGGVTTKKPENGVISSNPSPPPRVNKQKRLVRNGFISPNNIAKAKQMVGNDVNGCVAVGHNTDSVAIEHNTGSVAKHNTGSRASNPSPVSIDIRDLVAEDDDSHSRKGKGVISHPCSSRRSDWGTKNLHGRSFVSEKAVEPVNCNGDAGKSAEESAGWRSTRNRARGTNNISPDTENSLVRERVAPRSSIQKHETRSDRRGKGRSGPNCEDSPNDPSFISSEHFNVQPVKESVHHPRARLGQLNGPRSAAGTLLKRQKQGSAFSSYGECSTSVADNLEVVLLSSPAEAANSKYSSNANMSQIIEVDGTSSRPPHDKHDDNARARQLEADELMARELQEQFYNEMPVFGVQEADEHVALALQHQEGSNHGRSRGRPQVLDSRSMSNSHSRSSASAPRRGAPARSSSMGRMTRLRSRFPGQPRTLSSSQWRTSMFPPDMDIDMRMQILGALEEFSDMGMNAGILHANRDFNENDYEILLALDDNINHGGASGHQINSLPQSTVQTDHEEACAICLETPTTGEAIRHLPCLHKFHKDCIDPWLRRRTSCPVCKSSIT